MSDSIRGTLFFLYLICAISVAVPRTQAGGVDAALSTPERKQLQREARLVVDLLQNYHYLGRSFRDIANTEIVSRFVAELDPPNYFLTAADVEFLHRRYDHSLKSVYLLRGDLQPAFEIFDLLVERAATRHTWIKRRLAEKFDFTRDEYYDEPKASAGTPDGTAATDAAWELRLKAEVLAEILRGRDEPAATAAVGRRYERMIRQLAAADALAIRERFFDSLIRSFDPHSGYFSGDSAREFEVGMANAIGGVGLDLRRENSRCLVATVQPGGPADLQSEIQPGDVIEALAEADQEWTDASTRPVRELAKLVRGEPGTSLRVRYRAAGAERSTEVRLARARVLLGDERASGAVSEVPDGRGGTWRIGWIELPSFYAAGDGETGTSAARDVRDLLEQMSAKRIDGLVVDLRGNPGGAMSEAIDLSELFVPGGTVLLSRMADGLVQTHQLKEKSPLYTGPLILLTSPASASASEVFAGALKFHRRALIIGGAATFGKGTAQTYIELAKAMRLEPADAPNLGTLRLTNERFYLPDGGAVQSVGVPSDIVLFDDAPGVTSREVDLPHALPAESITPPEVAPAPTDGPASAAVRARARALAAENATTLPEWKLWRQQLQFLADAASRTRVNLNLKERKVETEKLDRDFEALRGEMRALAAVVAFPTEPLTLRALQPALAAHEAKLRAARAPDGQPLLFRLRRDSFIVETDHAHWRALRMGDFDFHHLVFRTAELAPAFSAGAGQMVAFDTITHALRDCSLLEAPTAEAVLACFEQNVAAVKLEHAAVRRGVEALLRRATEIDRELLRERHALDVPLRECLRLAAGWAGQAAERGRAPALP